MHIGTKGIYKKVYRNMVFNNPKMKTATMFIISRINTILWYEILFIIEKNVGLVPQHG